MCGVLPGRCLRWNLDVTQRFLSCPTLTIRPSPWARGPVAEPRTRPRAEAMGIHLGPEDPGSPSRSTEGKAGGHGR